MTSDNQTVPRLGIWVDTPPLHFSSPKHTNGQSSRTNVLLNGQRWSGGVEFIHLYPSSTDVRNEWKYTSIPLTRLRGLDRGILGLLIMS